MIVKRGEPKWSALSAIVYAVSANYKKHSIIVTLADSCELHDTYWDGGSRSNALVDTAAKPTPYRVKRFPQYAPPQFGGPQSVPVVQIKPGDAIVSTGLFCGKTATASITMRRETFEGLPS